MRTNWSGLRHDRELWPKRAGTFRVQLVGGRMVAAQAARCEDGVAPQPEVLPTMQATKPAAIERVEAALREGGHEIGDLQQRLVATCRILRGRRSIDGKRPSKSAGPREVGASSKGKPSSGVSLLTP